MTWYVLNHEPILYSVVVSCSTALATQSLRRQIQGYNLPQSGQTVTEERAGERESFLIGRVQAAPK